MHAKVATVANEEHLQKLTQGVEAWNAWRHGHPEIRIDLQKAIISGNTLSYANFRDVDLSGARLLDVDLRYAKLNGADLSRANLSGANLRQANFIETNLHGATLTNADLTRAMLIGTNLQEAQLNNCRIYGISVWDLDLTGAEQRGLIITPHGEPTITVDNLEVAQFIYLLLHNEKIRHVIDTITSKVVLILGRFTPARKVVLDAIREALRQRDWLPVLCDFPPPTSRDLTETITILARMARFIIADITDPKSIPQELEAIVPHLPSVPVQPLLGSSDSEYGMFEHFKRYPWVLETYQYSNLDELLHSLKDKVIIPAEVTEKH